MNNIKYEDFISLSKQEQEYYIKEMLLVINVINKNMISFEEVYIMLEIITPLIINKCLLGYNLKEFLENSFQNVNWNFRKENLNIIDYM